MKQLDILTAILLVVGGLNWGLVAFANFDLVAALTGAGGFGNKNLLGTIVYALVGLSAVYQAVAFRAARTRQPVAA
jgi:uncharacterized membrane protein YuzA (DUF378 family)